MFGHAFLGFVCGSLPELLPQSGDNEFDLGIQEPPLGVPMILVV